MIHEIYINRGSGYEWLAEIDAADLDEAEERLVELHATLPPKDRRGNFAIRPRGRTSHLLPDGWPVRRS